MRAVRACELRSDISVHFYSITLLLGRGQTVRSKVEVETS